MFVVYSTQDFLTDIYHRLQLGFVIRALFITLTFVARDFKKFLEKKNKEKKKEEKTDEHFFKQLNIEKY